MLMLLGIGLFGYEHPPRSLGVKLMLHYVSCLNILCCLCTCLVFSKSPQGRRQNRLQIHFLNRSANRLTSSLIGDSATYDRSVYMDGSFVELGLSTAVVSRQCV